MAQASAPAIGTVEDGYRFKGGNPSDQSSWEQVAPVDVSDRWGPGARQLPNGTIERVGPRGGVTTVANASAEAPGAPDAVGKLTEGQGKAVLYGTMMRGAERDYQAARENGYNPASFRNQAARVAGAVPFDGDFFGRLIRDDVSDAGNQAELRWAEGNLRQLTGAAATNPEIARVAAINFDRGNDELAAQRYRSRAETYQGTRYAAGPGAAVLGDYPGANAEAGPEVDGLPSYPGITARLAAAPASSAAPDGPEAPTPDGPFDPNAPRPGDVRVTAQPLAAEDTPESLRAQGYVYDEARDTWTRTRTAEARGWTPESAVAQRREMDDSFLGGIGRRADAFIRGAADIQSGEFADEAAAGADALFGQGVGGSIGERYGNNIQVQRAVDQADGEDMPGTRLAGQIAGGVVALPRIAAGIGLRGVAGFARNALAGAGLAGVNAAGNTVGDLAERGQNALRAAPVGAVVGALAGPVAERVAGPVVNALQGVGRFAGRQAGRVGSALGVPGATALTERATADPLQGAVARFAQRSPQEANALETKATRFRTEGIEPTLADVVNDGGRGTLRATASRQTPARQAAREFADNRAAGLQDRVSTQARRTISPDPRSPTEMTAEIAARRSREADAAFGAVRNELLQPDRTIIDALRAPALRPAIEEATTAARNRGDVETANLLQQLSEGALDNPNGVQVTVGMADRLARSLNGRAEGFQRGGNNDAASAYFSLAERLRGTARQQVPGYDEALKGYAQQSGLSDAVDLGEQFMTMEADQFAAAVSRLTPEEQEIARAAARRAVERQAGTQGAAPGVAQRLSGGREQGMRSQALLGDAEPMQRAMSMEREALRNAQAVNPMQGSPTSLNAQDAMGAAGIVASAARDIGTGNVGGLLTKASNAIRARGFNDAQAEAIVNAALDPARTDEIIAMLAERMSRREARNLSRMVRYQVASAQGRSTPQE